MAGKRYNRGRAPRNALCHPNRKHFCRGMCKQCYWIGEHARASDPMAGLVRVSVPGWGCVT